MANVSNRDNVIDSRDVIAHIEELKVDLADFTDDTSCIDADEIADTRAELKVLLALQGEAEGSPDWQYGESLVRDSYFKEYAQELAEDCGMLSPDASWPNNCIDWDWAARELQHDYFSVDFDGVTYWIRS